MKGQAMAVFKMLIGAVFAVALLMIVYSALNNIGCPYSSFDQMKNILSQASNIDNKCFKSDVVCFDKGAIIDSVALEKNLPGMGAIKVTGRGGDGFSCAADKCTFEAKMSIPTSAMCRSGVCTIYLNTISCS